MTFKFVSGDLMKKLTWFIASLLLIGSWQAATACPDGFQHLANNLCYKGYVPSCPEMAQGATKFIGNGKDSCNLTSGKKGQAPSCRKGGSLKEDYLLKMGKTNLPPHMNPKEDYCIQAQKTVYCLSPAQPVVGSQGSIMACKRREMKPFVCPAGMTFKALKGSDVTGMGCFSGPNVSAAKCEDGYTFKYISNKPICDGEKQGPPNLR